MIDDSREMHDACEMYEPGVRQSDEASLSREGHEIPRRRKPAFVLDIDIDTAVSHRSPSQL